ATTRPLAASSLNDDSQRSAGGQELHPSDVYSSMTGVSVAGERAWHEAGASAAKAPALATAQAPAMTVRRFRKRRSFRLDMPVSRATVAGLTGARGRAAAVRPGLGRYRCVQGLKERVHPSRLVAPQSSCVCVRLACAAPGGLALFPF